MKRMGLFIISLIITFLNVYFFINQLVYKDKFRESLVSRDTFSENKIVLTEEDKNLIINIIYEYPEKAKKEYENNNWQAVTNYVELYVKTVPYKNYYFEKSVLLYSSYAYYILARNNNSDEKSLLLEKAINDTDIYNSLNTKNPMSYYIKGLSLLEQEKYIESIDMFDKSIKNGNNYLFDYHKMFGIYKLASKYYSENNYNEAKKNYSEVLYLYESLPKKYPKQNLEKAKNLVDDASKILKKIKVNN